MNTIPKMDETNTLIRELLSRLTGSEGQGQGQPVIQLQDSLKEIIAFAQISDVTRIQYEHGLQLFEEFLGRGATSADLTHENVNQWLVWLAQSRGVGPVTIRNQRVALARIWNHLAQDGLVVPYVAKKIRAPKVRPKRIEAWSTGQVRCLLRAASEFPGRVRCGIKASDFMRALILMAYDSGLRPGDLRRMKWQDVDFEQGSATIMQNKTGNPHAFPVSEATLDSIKSIAEPHRAFVFPLGKSGIEIKCRKLFEFAKKRHGFTRKKGQGIGTMRKVHATEVYKQHGLAAAAESLGHVSGSGIAKRHYVDSSAQHIGKLPPELAL